MTCPRCEVPLLWAYSDISDRRGHYAHLDTYLFIPPNIYHRLTCHIDVEEALWMTTR